ncbi:MAG TPA: hypothetical protein VIJ25_06355, partial [Methylococcales bacterium]
MFNPGIPGLKRGRDPGIRDPGIEFPSLNKMWIRILQKKKFGEEKRPMDGAFMKNRIWNLQVLELDGTGISRYR